MLKVWGKKNGENSPRQAVVVTIDNNVYAQHTVICIRDHCINLEVVVCTIEILQKYRRIRINGEQVLTSSGW